MHTNNLEDNVCWEVFFLILFADVPGVLFSCKKIEDAYIKNDGIIDERIDSIIIDIGGDSLSEESTDDLDKNYK